jgi:hypothetical protein
MMMPGGSGGGDLLHVFCWGVVFIYVLTLSRSLPTSSSESGFMRELGGRLLDMEGLGFGFYLLGAWVFDTTRVSVFLVMVWSNGAILSHSLYGMFKCIFVHRTLALFIYLYSMVVIDCVAR